MKRNSKGFTLIELMIVVAIIAIIAAIAIPNLLRSRISANEAGAIGAMRTLSTAQQSYQSGAILDADADGIGEYAAAIGDLLAPAQGPAFIDPQLGAGSKSGYTFVTAAVAANPETSFTANGTPANVGVSGQRAFFVDESGVIRFDITGAAADVNDPPVS